MLALSGGGTRGYAHVGVLKALEEAAIPIDGIAGCSAGGMMGGLYAAGYDADALIAEIQELVSLRGIVKSITPTFGQGLGVFEQLTVDNRFRSNLNAYIPAETRFADLSMPFAVDVVCLDRRKLVTLTDGKVGDALRATVAVPGIFPSVTIDGYRYIDGGVLNNVPSQAARDLTASDDALVIAVDLGNNRRRDGARSPLSRIRPAHELLETINLMLTHNTALALAASPPDVLIRPKLPPRSNPLADFRQIEAIIEAGHSATRAALPQIQSLLN